MTRYREQRLVQGAVLIPRSQLASLGLMSLVDLVRSSLTCCTSSRPLLALHRFEFFLSRSGLSPAIPSHALGRCRNVDEDYFQVESTFWCSVTIREGNSPLASFPPLKSHAAGPVGSDYCSAVAENKLRGPTPSLYLPRAFCRMLGYGVVALLCRLWTSSKNRWFENVSQSDG